MSETKLGKITTTPKGEWSSTTSYERLDIVQLKGTSWMAKRANTGVEPVEGDDWMLSAEGAPQIDDTTISAETPWSSKNTVDRFCPEITGEGNPVVLENCIEDYPLDVTASWGVQQEGSGTPHIEGYGTNKFRWAEADETLTSRHGLTLEYKAADETMHIYGTNTYTSDAVGQFVDVKFPASFTNMIKAGKTITLSVLSSSGFEGLYFSINYYTTSGSENGLINWQGSNSTVTVPDDFAKLAYSFFVSYKTLTTIDTTIKIQIEEGSTATEWTPYAANIRPFVGKDSVSVSRYGKNLAKCSSNVLTATLVNVQYRVFPKGTYYISASKVVKGGDNYPYIVFCEDDGSIISGTFIEGGKTATVVLDKPTGRYEIYANGFSYYGSQGITSTLYDFMITTDPNAEYEPYVEPTTVTLSLPETIYAGSVGTDGKVERDVFIEQFTGEEKWYCSSNPTWTDHFYVYSKVTTPYNSQKSNGVIFCDHFYAGKYSDTYNKGVISVSSDGSFNFVTPYDSLDEWVAYLKEQYAAGTPVTVVATPAAKRPTLTTTPAALPALSGANTITTDADTMTVTARKDRLRFTGDDVSESLGYIPAAQTDLEATQATVGEMIVNSSTMPWQTVQNIVQSGIAPQVFPVGTQFKVNSSKFGTMLWDVIHHNDPNYVNTDNPADYNMILQMHNILYGWVFDEREAMYVVNADTWADGMPAGTYSFTLLADYDTTYGGGKTYYFTTTKTIPVGGCIVLEWFYKTLVTNCYLKTYESMGSMTVLESIKPIEGSSGTSLGTGDGNSPHMSYTKTARYGYSDYYYSNIRQQLNSNLASGWWKSSEEFDRPSSITSSGFLYGMDTEFLSVVGAVDIQTNVNTAWNIDGIKTGSRTTKDKFFLPSVKEVGLGTDYAGCCNWGNVFDYYDGISNTSRIKYTKGGSMGYWWLRSPHPPYADDVRDVTSSGGLYGNSCNSGYGIAPCCVIY